MNPEHERQVLLDIFILLADRVVTEVQKKRLLEAYFARVEQVGAEQTLIEIHDWVAQRNEVVRAWFAQGVAEFSKGLKALLFGQRQDPIASTIEQLTRELNAIVPGAVR